MWNKKERHSDTTMYFVFCVLEQRVYVSKEERERERKYHLARCTPGERAAAQKERKKKN
jgi:hypothetical protein